MGHAEYDRDTLRREYMRDLAAGVDIQIPQHYFPGDDPSRKPRMNCALCPSALCQLAELLRVPDRAL